MYHYLGFNKLPLSKITIGTKKGQDLSLVRKETFVISNADTKTPYQIPDR